MSSISLSFFLPLSLPSPLPFFFYLPLTKFVLTRIFYFDIIFSFTLLCSGLLTFLAFTKCNKKEEGKGKEQRGQKIEKKPIFWVPFECFWILKNEHDKDKRVRQKQLVWKYIMKYFSLYHNDAFQIVRHFLIDRLQIAESKKNS